MNYGISEMAKVWGGMISRLDVVSNNLANIGAPGFKIERLHFGTKENTETKGGAPQYPSFTFADFSQGVMEKTDNALDMAIQGEGFFTIQTKDVPVYTRKGNFTVDKSNRLVTQSGNYVLGEAGPITINSGNVNIDNHGNIEVDGAAAGKLRIVKFDNLQALIRRGDGLFSDPGSGGMRKMENPDVKPRHLEQANVNAIREMAEMINIQRSFESYQKVIQMMADMDKLSTGRVGRLA